MALAPDTPNETFLREVDENLRRDQMRDLARRYAKWIIAAVVLFLAGVGAWLYWQNREQQRSQQQSEELAQVYTDISGGRMQTVPPRLESLAKADGDAIRASALLAQAAVALERNDRTAAIHIFGRVANDGRLPQPYRDLATIRRAALEFDTLPPEQVIVRLQTLATPGNPWFGSAGEITAMAYLKQGQRERAGRLFAAIAADREVPETLRSRAVQIAGTLGVDASASLPTLVQ